MLACGTLHETIFAITELCVTPYATWYIYVKIRIHKTVIMSVFLYGCETWSPILKEEYWCLRKGAEENIFAKEGLCDSSLEKIT
jgi:hypothetical protein